MGLSSNLSKVPSLSSSGSRASIIPSLSVSICLTKKSILAKTLSTFAWEVKSLIDKSPLVTSATKSLRSVCISLINSFAEGVITLSVCNKLFTSARLLVTAATAAADILSLSINALLNISSSMIFDDRSKRSSSLAFSASALATLLLTLSKSSLSSTIDCAELIITATC